MKREKEKEEMNEKLKISTETLRRAWCHIQYRAGEIIEVIPDSADQKSEEIEMLIELHLAQLAHKKLEARQRYLRRIQKLVEIYMTIALEELCNSDAMREGVKNH